MLKTGLFAIVLLLIAPSTRNRIMASIDATIAWTIEYAPLSFLAFLIPIATAIAAFVIVKNAPKWEEPESPMAKYRREAESADEMSD